MKEKITVIAGGSSGIGMIIVNKFLQKGDKVIVIDNSKISNRAIEKNESYVFIKADITNPDEIDIAKKKVEKKFKKIDTLISIAGISMKSEIGGIETVTIEDIDKTIKLNLNSHIYLVKIFCGLLEKSTTAKNIMMISSTNSISCCGLPVYSSAKAALYSFMKAVEGDFSGRGIRINMVSMGVNKHCLDANEQSKYIELRGEKSSLNEFIRPTDVADTIYNLVYKMKAIVGQNIVFDVGQNL